MTDGFIEPSQTHHYHSLPKELKPTHHIQMTNLTHSFAGLFIYFICIVKYNRRSNISDIKSNTLTKNGFKNHGFVGDIERHPSLSFNSHSQMTYKSDDLTETENENVYQAKINPFELEQEIPISPKSVKKAKAPIPVSFKTNNQSQAEASTSSVTKSRTPSPNSGKHWTKSF